MLSAKQRLDSRLASHRLPSHLPPMHPGEMLFEEFLKPLGITQSEFARQLGVSLPRLNEVVNRKRSVTLDPALRLAGVTGMSADFWLGLQQDWDLWHALRSEVAEQIGRLEPIAPTGLRACRKGRSDQERSRKPTGRLLARKG